MKIPTFEEAKQALIEKRGTPLDKFVAYWEPRDEDVKFRHMLMEMLVFILEANPETVTLETVLINPDAVEKMMVNQNYGTQESLVRSFWNPSTNQYEEKK